MFAENQSVIRHYFDWAATAPQDNISPSTDDIPAVTADKVPFGNPSSRHFEGRSAKEALESARSRCAAVLGIKPETLYFTSGGTEANCISLFSNLLRPAGRITCSLAEHPSITENVDVLNKLGKPTGKLPVDVFGRLSPEILEKILEKYSDTRYAAIMYVNNETGAINNIKSINDFFKNNKKPVHFHCDMVQAAGKIPIDLSFCDSASFSAHKIGGPRGIGLLYLRRNCEVLYSGGGQERKIRPGTENTLGALAMAHCLEKHAASNIIETEYAKALSRMKYLMDAIDKTGRCVIIPAERKENEDIFSPYILQAAFMEIPGEVMVRALDDLGFAISTGSACSSSTSERPVLKAMGIDEKTMRCGIRISQGWSTTDEEIDFLADAIKKTLAAL